MYELLRKEAPKSNINLPLLRSLSDECLARVKYIGEIDVDSTRAPVLEILKKSIQHVNDCLNNNSEESWQNEDSKQKYLPNSMDFDQQTDSESTHKSYSYSNEQSNTSDGQLNTRMRAVEDTIIRNCNVTFDDVVGLVEAKRTLHEAIVMPTRFPQLFTGNRKPWRRILLYGPPGTGKSRLAMAVAGQIKTSFYSVSSSDMLSCWFGESEKLIRDLFAHSRSRKETAVIFMDEIDGLCRRRNSTEQEATRRIKTELLLQMDNIAQTHAGSNKEKNEDVIIICATNSPWEIDPAFLRRFQKRIYIPLPDKSCRRSILELHCNKTECELTEAEWEILGENTEGFSGSDLANLANAALFEPIRDLESATHFVETTDKKYRHCSVEEKNAIKCALSEIPSFLVLARKLEFRDFERCLVTNKATISRDDMENFERFTAKFGQLGR
uniref:vacuolar protein sorting-associated protein 4-like isoform X1 n=2 Tax=Styela clava TaxID=7725 RepID=UPI00193ABF02|nr:vacuolar protein sorting-associated protein 4-like isoform X1 [Styela clava]